MTPSPPRDQSERPLLMFASRYYDWNTLYPLQSFTSAHCRFRNTLLAKLKVFPQTKSNQNVTTVWGECFDWSSARDFYAHCCFRAPATHSHYFFRGGNHSWKLCTHEYNEEWIRWHTMNFFEYVWIRGIQKIPSEYKNYRRNTKKYLITDEYTGIHLNSNWIRENTMYFFEYVWIRGIKKIPSEYKNCRRNAKKFSDYRWIHGNSPEFKLNSVEYNEFARGAEVMNTYEYIWIQYDCVWIL